MGKRLDFISNDILPDFAIKAERSDEFHAAAKELSAFILSLPLSHADNDKLIQLMTNNICLAERSAFEQGIRLTKSATEHNLLDLE